MSGMIKKRCCCCQPITCEDCFSGAWPPPTHMNTIYAWDFPDNGSIHSNLALRHDWNGISPWGPADERIGAWQYRISYYFNDYMPFYPVSSVNMRWQSYSIHLPFTFTVGKFLRIQAFFEDVLVYDNNWGNYPSIGAFGSPLNLLLSCEDEGWRLHQATPGEHNLLIDDYLCVDSCGPEGNPRMSNYKDVICKIYDYTLEEWVPYNTANFFSIAWYGYY